MPTPDTDPARREYRLKAPLIQRGVQRLAGASVWLRPDQAARLDVVPADQAVPGVINITQARAKPGRANKEG